MNYAGYNSVCFKWQSYHIGLRSNSESEVRGVKHKIFDAGCGTGLVGEALVSLVPRGLIEIHGGDVSTNMLEIARSKDVYADLQIVNLKEELPYQAESFDSVLCAGVFGIGHCGPECVPNLLRILKRECYLIATVNRELYDDTMPEWKKQIKNCNCELVEDNEMPYRDAAKAVVIVVRKQVDNDL